MTSKANPRLNKSKSKRKIAPPPRRQSGSLDDAALDGVTGGLVSLRPALPGVEGAAALPGAEVATCLSQV